MGGRRVLAQLTYEDFKDHRGKTFELQGTGGRVEITLLDVRLSPFPKGVKTMRQAFAILFAAPREPFLGDGMYNIRHPKRGVMEGIHIKPVMPPAADVEKTKHVRFYEAIFN